MQQPTCGQRTAAGTLAERWHRTSSLRGLAVSRLACSTRALVAAVDADAGSDGGVCSSQMAPTLAGSLDARRSLAAGARMRAASAAALGRLATSSELSVFARLAASVGEVESTPGFFEPALLPTLATLDAVMCEHGVRGAVCEIGVYHGRCFAPLALLRREGERAVAVDVFGQQSLNQDASGKGSEAAFYATLKRFGIARDGVVVLSCDSTTLCADALLEAAGGPIRLMSVDGSHTEAAAASDLRLAQLTLAPGGVCILDDALNPDWPGVISGLARHLAEGGSRGEEERAGSLVPFCLGYNKCLLTTSAEFAATYAEALAPLARKRADFMGHTCLILPAGWIAAHFGNDAPPAG